MFPQESDFPARGRNSNDSKRSCWGPEGMCVTHRGVPREPHRVSSSAAMGNHRDHRNSLGKLLVSLLCFLSLVCSCRVFLRVLSYALSPGSWLCPCLFVVSLYHVFLDLSASSTVPVCVWLLSGISLSQSRRFSSVLNLVCISH